LHGLNLQKKDFGKITPYPEMRQIDFALQ